MRDPNLSRLVTQMLVLCEYGLYDQALVSADILVGMIEDPLYSSLYTSGDKIIVYVRSALTHLKKGGKYEIDAARVLRNKAFAHVSPEKDEEMAWALYADASLPMRTDFSGARATFIEALKLCRSDFQLKFEILHAILQLHRFDPMSRAYNANYLAVEKGLLGLILRYPGDLVLKRAAKASYLADQALVGKYSLWFYLSGLAYCIAHGLDLRRKELYA